MHAGPHAFVYVRFGSQRPRRALPSSTVQTAPARSGAAATPPHTLTAQGGRLYGLGSADTKGAIAAMLARSRDTGPPRRRRAVLRRRGAGSDRASRASSRDAARAASAGDRLRADRRAARHRPPRRRARDRALEGHGGHSSKADFMPKPMVQLARSRSRSTTWAAPPPRRSARHAGHVPQHRGAPRRRRVQRRPHARHAVAVAAPGPRRRRRDLLAEAERRGAPRRRPTHRLAAGHASPPLRHPRPGRLRAAAGRAGRDAVDLGFWTEAALFAERRHRRGGVRPGRHRAGSRRRRVRRDRQLETARDAFLRRCFA